MPESVTLSFEEYANIKLARETAEAEAAGLRADLVKAKNEDPSGRINQLGELARELIQVLRFAVGNLPPETTRHWPFRSLEAAAKLLPWLPDFTPDDNTLAIELKAFANEVMKYEAQRSRRRRDAEPEQRVSQNFDDTPEEAEHQIFGSSDDAPF